MHIGNIKYKLELQGNIKNTKIFEIKIISCESPTTTTKGNVCDKVAGEKNFMKYTSIIK